MPAVVDGGAGASHRRWRDKVAVVATAPPTPVPAATDLRAELRGRHVVVEPLAAGHRDGLRAAAVDSEMFRWLGVDLSDSDALGDWIDTALRDAERGVEVPFVIRSAADGTVLGTTRFLSLQLEHLLVEIGWTWVTPGAWRSGVNVETKLLLLTHAFEAVGLRRVEFKTDARNERSRGALAALPAQYEGVFRKHRVLPGGGVRDSAYYSIIDDEWPGVRRHLQDRLAALEPASR